MKKMRHNLFLVCLLVLCTTICHAETITTTHVFSNMGTQIQYSDGNTVAKTELLTYTCKNGAKFDADPDKTTGKISIFMDKSGATVTTTQVDNLRQLIIHYYYYYYEGKELYDADEITISISVDGQVWNAPDEITYTKGVINVVLPAGDYYLQIKRKNKNFYIHQITYYTEKCACFPYIKPE